MSLTTSIQTGGTNSHQTTSEEANALGTDTNAPGVIGVITNTSGVAPSTGAFAVNAQGTPDMTVAVSAGVAYVTATPSGGNSQLFRVKNSASANVTIAANASGGTRYDWVYIQLAAATLANPNSAGTDAATLVTSRSTSNTTDNGTPPTYGTLLAIVTVINGASSIANGSIADKRVRTGFMGNWIDTNGNEIAKSSATASAVNEVTVTNAATGNNPQISATGDDTNIHLSLTGKGTGGVLTKNPYKFSVYRNAALSVATGAYALVPFDTKEYDTGSNVDVTTNKGRFTAPIAGYYLFSFLVAVGISDTDDVAVLYKNGSIYKWGNESKGGGTGGTFLVQAAANDYFEVYVSTSVAAIGVGNAPQKTWFSGFLLSAT